MKKIVITSSSDSFLERNSTLLRHSDFLITTSNRGAQVLELLRKEGLDLIVADIQLEDMSGEKLCEMITGEGSYPGLSLILVTRDENEDVERGIGCGAHAVIPRPIKPLQLIKTVGQFLTVQLVRNRRVTLRVKVVSRKEAAEFFCISHNISVTGIMIEVEHHFDVGSILNCIFTIPGSLQVEAEGEIFRAVSTIEGSYLYGLQFTSLSRASKQAIELYIKRVEQGEISNY